MRERLNTVFARQKKWGKIEALRFDHTYTTPSGSRKAMWRFRCDCGAEKVMNAYDVRSGKITSCGCQSAEVHRKRLTTHGAASAKTPEYRSWRNMLTRGRNPNIAAAPYYVLRGITVCPEWQAGGDGRGFERFLAHIGPKPSAEMSVDRIENDRGYEPGNVRWATVEQQTQNTSGNHLIEFDGEMLPLSVAARRAGISRTMLKDRIRLGWPKERWFESRARAEYGRGRHSRPGVMPRS
jgi:hypothetical protein